MQGPIIPVLIAFPVTKPQAFINLFIRCILSGHLGVIRKKLTDHLSGIIGD